MPQQDAKRLYVGNLAWSVTTADLKRHFSQFGTVTDAHVMEDRETQRSRGFGFVTMADEHEAENAIDRANGQEFEGREITVNVAEVRQDRRGGGGRQAGESYGGRRGGGRR